MGSPSPARLPGFARLLLGFAAGWSVLIILAGALVPVISSVTMSSSDTTASSGEVTYSTLTLLSSEGLSVLLVLSVPLLITCAVALALVQRRRRGAAAIAWTLTGLLAAANVLALMSIGIVVVPVTAALIVACATSLPHRATVGALGPTTP